MLTQKNKWRSEKVDHFINKGSPYIYTHCCRVAHIMIQARILQDVHQKRRTYAAFRYR